MGNSEVGPAIGALTNPPRDSDVCSVSGTLGSININIRVVINQALDTEITIAAGTVGGPGTHFPRPLPLRFLFVPPSAGTCFLLDVLI